MKKNKEKLTELRTWPSGNQFENSNDTKALGDESYPDLQEAKF